MVCTLSAHLGASLSHRTEGVDGSRFLPRSTECRVTSAFHILYLDLILCYAVGWSRQFREPGP